MTKPDNKVKKTLVRNPEQPKTGSSLSQKTSETNSPILEPAAVSTKKKLDKNPGFDVPEIHSTLKISKKIDKIVKPSIKLIKSLTDVAKNKLAVDDKVSRQVNFPIDQPVFKNLIPLGDDNDVKTEPFTATRDLLEELDPEPNFADYSNKDKRKQTFYHSEPERVLDGLDNASDNAEDVDYNPFNGLKLYNTLLLYQYPDVKKVKLPKAEDSMKNKNSRYFPDKDGGV